MELLQSSALPLGYLAVGSDPVCRGWETRSRKRKCQTRESVGQVGNRYVAAGDGCGFGSHWLSSGLSQFMNGCYGPFAYLPSMDTLWKNDDELFATARRELFTAVVGDIMDQMG